MIMDDLGLQRVSLLLGLDQARRGTDMDYPLVMTNIAMDITMFTGKTHYKWPFIQWLC